MNRGDIPNVEGNWVFEQVELDLDAKINVGESMEDQGWNLEVA
jgi:hypothetical protein